MANELDLTKIIKGLEESSKAFDNLSDKVKELIDSFIKGQKVFNEASNDQNDLSKKTKQVADSTEELSDSQKELEKIEKRRQKLTKKVIFAQEEEKKRVKELREEYKKQTGQQKKNISFTQKLTKAFSVSLLKITAVIGAIKLLIDAGKAYLNNIQELNKQTSQVAATFEISRVNAAALTKDMRRLASAFDKDFNDVLKTSTVLSKEFGLTGRQSLKLIEDGFRRGADQNGEFLELLKEYPAQLKSVGLSAKQSIALITQTERAGLFSDKGIDAIKEAGIRLRELTPATEAALNAIGLSGKEIQRQLETGEKTLFEVTQQVSSKLSELPPQSKEVGAAIADIFGGPGEDAGLGFLTTLQDINLELDSITTTLSPLEEATANLKGEWSGLRDEISKGDSFLSKFIATEKQYLANKLNSFKLLLKGEKGLAEEIKILAEEKEKQEVLAAQQTEKEAAAIEAVERKKRDEIRKTLELRRLALEEVKQAEKTNAELIDKIFTDAELEIQDEINNTILAIDSVIDKLPDDSQKIADSLKDISKQFKQAVAEDTAEVRRQIVDIIGLSQDLSSTFFDFRNSQRELELQDLDIQRDAQIAAAGDSASAREKIEKDFADKQKKLKTEQAKADKRQALFNITLATAQAVISSLASIPPNVPLSIFAGILGAAQFSAAAATPIPGFFKGVENKKDSGYGIVGEKGREIVDIPGHAPMISPDTASTMYLPKGTSVIPNVETEQILKSSDTKEYEVLKSIDKKLSNQNNKSTPIWTGKAMRIRDEKNRIDRDYLNTYRG